MSTRYNSPREQFVTDLLWSIRWGISDAVDKKLKDVDIAALIKEATIEYLKAKEVKD